MKLIYLKILVVLALTLGTSQSYAQICYETYNSFSGLNIDGFQNIAETSTLNQKACNLITVINDACDNGNNNNFKVFGGAFLPVLAYTDLVQYQIFEDQFNETIAALNYNNDSYIYLGKEIRIDDTGTESVFFRIELKLPSCSPEFQELTVFEQEAIKSMVLEAINEEATSNSNSIPSAVGAEIAGLEKLTTFIQQISSGTFEINEEEALLANGFNEIELSASFIFSNFTYVVNCDNDNFFGENLIVSDYSCLEVHGNSFRILLDETLILMGESESQFIITSNVMQDVNVRQSLAEVKYNNTDNFVYLFWMHFVFTDNGINIFYKTRTNNNAERSEELINEAYNNWMSPEEEALHGVNEGSRDDTNGAHNCSSGADDSVPCGDFNSIEEAKKWRAYCCLMNDEIRDNIGVGYLEVGVTCGLIDGLWETIIFSHGAGSWLIKQSDNMFFTPLTVTFIGPVGFLLPLVNFCKHYKREGNFRNALKAQFQDDSQIIKDIQLTFDVFWSKREEIKAKVLEGIQQFFNDLDPRTGLGTTGYSIGKILFEVLMDIVTGGGKTYFTIGENAMSVLRRIGTHPELIVDDIAEALRKSKAFTKKAACKIRYGGCFVTDTPVLMANKNNVFQLGNAAKGLAVAAAMPIITVPIQEVQLLDYAVAHKTVNNSYNLTASINKNDVYLGAYNEDLYTSNQQKERDRYALNNVDWYEVVFEEVLGTSTCKLALHEHWIRQKKYVAGGVVDMNLPEQGISGAFKITSIKHIIPQKMPVDDDESDDYNYRPVTALFTHVSDQVYTIDFDNGESLGVTYQHPIYSVTAGNWKLAGELEVGEKVLTKEGEATVTSSGKKEGTETVYNLEIQELHNFLVGESGVVVHNSCFFSSLSNLPILKVLPSWVNDVQTGSSHWVNPAGIFKNAQGKKIITVIPDNVQQWQWDQGFDFIVTKNGQLKIGSGHGFMAGHTGPNVNPEILGAGRIKVNKSSGKVEWINGQSGHYQPNAVQFQKIKQKFINEGLLY